MKRGAPAAGAAAPAPSYLEQQQQQQQQAEPRLGPHRSKLCLGQAAAPVVAGEAPPAQEAPPQGGGGGARRPRPAPAPARGIRRCGRAGGAGGRTGPCQLAFSLPALADRSAAKGAPGGFSRRPAAPRWLRPPGPGRGGRLLPRCGGQKPPAPRAPSSSPGARLDGGAPSEGGAGASGRGWPGRAA